MPHLHPERLGRAAGDDVGGDLRPDHRRRAGSRPSRPCSSAGSASRSRTRTSWRCSPRRSRLGCAVELITNGTRLDEDTRRELVRIGLDRLWVSIDGATPESYADVRLWDALPQVTEDLARLRELRIARGSGLPRLGIAFVAMKRNIADLPEVIRLGQRLGADRYSVSNVLAHTPEMREQVLYAGSIDAEDVEPSPWTPEISLPRMDLDELTIERLAQVAAGRQGRSLPGRAGGAGANVCPFVEKGSVSVRWDGAISPCLPLLHTHRSYLDFRPRTSHAFSVANVNEREPGRGVERSGLRRAARAAPGLRLRPLHDLQQLRHGRREPRGLLRQPHPGLWRLPLGPGVHPLPVGTGPGPGGSSPSWDDVAPSRPCTVGADAAR